MKQIFLVNGGEVFDNKENYQSFLEECPWDLTNPPKNRKNRLCDSISDHYQCFKLELPNSFDAKYRAWKIWFEKYLKYLNGEDVVLIGRSLGGTFLLKYLSENCFWENKKPRHYKIQLHLVAPMLDSQGFDSMDRPGKLVGVGDFVIDKDMVHSIVGVVDEIFLYHSQDDAVVPFNHSERLNQLLPDAKFEVFETRGHFMQPAFPELLENIGVYTR